MNSKTVRSQPPSDHNYLIERDVPEGYHLEWGVDDHWRFATDEERATRKCRRPGCKREVVAGLKRGSGRSEQWWLYCDWHLYGRRIENGEIQIPRLKPNIEVREFA